MRVKGKVWRVELCMCISWSGHKGASVTSLAHSVYSVHMHADVVV